MAVIRIEKTKDYTVMSNYHFKEKEMSLKAKGLLSLMLSLPEKWDYSIAGLVSICKENETSIKTALEELKQFGYLEIIKKMPNETKSGRIEYEYVVYEKKQEGKKQDLENLGVEILHVENPIQYNTNKLNTNELNIKYKEIFDHWNSKSIIKHSVLNDTILKAIKQSLKEFSIEQIKLYIDRYAQVINNKDYFFNTKWTLAEFLKQKNAMRDFTDEGSKWLNYITCKAKSKSFKARNYTEDEANALFDNIDEINW